MASTPTTTHLSRRMFLKSTLLVAAAGPLLSACGDDAGTGSSGGTGTAAELPTYKPVTGLTPDLPGNDQGVQSGFLQYPADRFDSVEGNPLSGGSISALVISYAPPPPALSQNKYWQAVNDRMGGTVETTPTPAADYMTKFSTVTSGTEVPDLVLVPLFQPVPRLPQLLESQFADLSEHLSGDAVLDYPNLANIPTYAWRNVLIDGKIAGVPIERPAFYNPLFYRRDLFDQLGITPATDADSFLTMCQDLTDESAGRWALGSQEGANTALNRRQFLCMFGAPNNWRLDSDGTLTKDVETEEFTEAVAFMRQLWEAGVYHPDAPSMTVAQAKDALVAGSITMLEDGLAGWGVYYDTYRSDHPDLRIGAWVPVAHDGGEAQAYLDKGAFGFVGIKKGDTGRVEELLRAVNLFCAPFGSTEYELLKFGVEGHDFDFDASGIPVKTETATAEQATNFHYLGAGPDVLFHGNYPDRVEDQHAWEEQIAPIGIADPTVGLFSDTYGREAATLDQKVGDTVLAVITGRSPIDELDGLADVWRNGGGDQIREEYQEALA